MTDEYYRAIEKAVRSCKIARGRTIYRDERENEILFLRGDIYFSDGSRLHFREFVQIKRDNRRTATLRLSLSTRRWDARFSLRDTDHFPNLPTAPHHKHLEETEVIAADVPDLQSVLKEIEALIGT